MTKEERRKKTGDRLREVYKKKGMTQGQLLDAAAKDDRFTGAIQQSHLSNIINAKGRDLSDYDADIFSDVLGIHRGYLKGEDDYKAANYDDYLIGYVKQPQLQQDFHRYDGILSLAGAKIEHTHYDDDYNINQYDVYMDGRRASFTPEKMDEYMKRVYAEICAFARKELDPIMDLGSPAPRPMNVNVEHGTITDDERKEGR